MSFVSNFTKALTVKQKAKCLIAKIFGGHVVTPLGRVMLLPKDYDALAIATGNKDVLSD